MKATWRWLAALALLTMMCGPAGAESGRLGSEAAGKPAAWERVGDRDGTTRTADPAKSQAALEDDMRARKAEVVRRVLWIVIAHR